MDYYMDYYDEIYPYVHVDDLPDWEDLRQRMKKILQIVYGNRSLDELDDNFEEICGALDLNIPLTPVKIKKI